MSKQDKTTTASRLAAYSAAAAATAVAGSAADAAEVITDITDITANVVSFDLVNQTASSGYTTAAAGGQFAAFNFYLYGVASFGYELGGSSSSYKLAVPLGAGASVPGALNFGYASISSYAYVNLADSYGNGLSAGQTAFVGVKFDIGPDTHYGWIQLTREASGITVHGFGYNDTPGAASVTVDTVDPVPEPSSLALLAMGGAALLRRKRKDVA